VTRRRTSRKTEGRPLVSERQWLLISLQILRQSGHWFSADEQAVITGFIERGSEYVEVAQTELREASEAPEFKRLLAAMTKRIEQSRKSGKS
jgi:hypothetical protein